MEQPNRMGGFDNLGSAVTHALQGFPTPAAAAAAVAGDQVPVADYIDLTMANPNSGNLPSDTNTSMPGG